jgi:hypothetical protein
MSSSKNSKIKKKQYKIATTASEYKIKINHEINPAIIIVNRLVVVRPMIFVLLVKSI